MALHVPLRQATSRNPDSIYRKLRGLNSAACV